MTKPRKGPGSQGHHAPSEGERSEESRVLRAKYLDYCSAKVAEVLLTLSADEMYVLAHEVLEETPREGDEPLTYEEIVRLATERISAGLSLPSFEEWKDEYRRNPERFDREIMGLWEGEVDDD